jgi:TPR repeat protein
MGQIAKASLGYIQVSAYRQAAEQGDAEAQFILGGCYKYGDVVEENPAEAARCLNSFLSWRK